MRHSKKMQITESDGLDKHQHVPSKKSQSSRRSNGSSGKQLQQLSILYQDAMDLYNQSSLAETIQDMLRTKNRPRITRIVSLGLGSLLDAKDQQRRIKQLVMLMAIASHLTLPKNALQIYAQDPTFTEVDETFLASLGIVVLKTPSIADLGEAGQMMDEETLVYSPFLTLETYKLLLSSSQTSDVPVNVPMLISDDFNALRLKWDKRTSERKDVEGLIQGTRAGNYRRRAVNGEGFWTDLDRPFPLALYLRQSTPARNADTRKKTRVFSQFEQSSIPIYA
ncbi:hypothetical protein FVEN_g10262 [Fusarium venenatum]|uniref:SRR1-like domain-containing protein n=1 Tax=Fusarium venenatum TaxID=56646 RepID=A0A2L2SWR6_9HYPO|nr:uncharacterized protein FVRRES_06678 [Fusarium venenatum]KAG8351543.1 hypothetical protein FVEN_g10262 [Fusarium venenatum]KAH6993658.1 hypothetical protein EDB82DRAFT_536615 [Fusarium venenatum]CEI62242.1 unnamed protein product [Fusarium venenatum]